MPETPSLRLIEDALEAMAHRIPGLLDEARWLWPVGYERRRGDRAGGGFGISKPTEVAAGHDVWVCEPGECPAHEKGGERHSASPEWVLRTNVHLAGKRIIEAAAQLARARAALEVAAKAAGRGEDLLPVEEQLVRTASKSEVAKARQMKRWRDEERPKGAAHGTY